MQPDLATWLARKPAGKKKRKPIPLVSKRRVGEQRLYLKLRRELLRERPLCEAHAIIWPGEPVPRSQDCHHVAGRIGANLTNKEFLMAVSRKAHDFIHQHPAKARAMGLLL